MKNERRKALVRLIVMVILTTNMALTLAGKNPLPLDENLLAEWLSVGLAGLSVVWGWWKDNPVTRPAQEAHKVLEVLKTDFKDDGEDPSNVPD